MKYRIEFHINQDIISIHVTLPLSNTNRPYYSEHNSGPPPAPFADIFKIPGVVNVNRKNKYEMSITKGSAFEWDEIIEKAMDTVGLLLSPDVPPERGPDM
ncbi:hypothetical protein H7Y21_01270, partial [Arenimonas sp.]|nr:hypothetical protein [Candidatus Parcubacteria bacterium]